MLRAEFFASVWRAGVFAVKILVMDVPDDGSKRAFYAQAVEQLAGLLADEVDQVARMAGLVSVIHRIMPHFYWTGFYRVVGSELVIGPYQGTPGCSRIAWGRGVCGTAWQTGVTQIVADVHAFPGHIACDAASASEIVVPVMECERVVPVMECERVVAILDVDSAAADAFGEVDAVGLRQVLRVAGW